VSLNAKPGTPDPEKSHHDFEHVFLDRRLSRELRAVLAWLPALGGAQPGLMALDALPARLARAYAGVAGNKPARKLLRRLQKLSHRAGRPPEDKEGVKRSRRDGP
jgi:hypothetical protein